MESNEAQYLFTESELNALIADERAAEREACAKMADDFDPEMKMSNYGQIIANRIRARGQK